MEPLAAFARAARARRIDLPEPAPHAPSLRARLDAAPGVLAELKPASPTEGRIRDLAAPGAADDVARALAKAGAAGISALTEPTDFHGGPHLLAAAARSGAPALLKDFVVTHRQLDLAREGGASAVLLILPLLNAEHSEWKNPEEALDAAWERDLEVLLEVYDDAEVLNAVALGADMVGINNRDLRDPRLPVDTGRSLALLRKYSDWDVPFLALSGAKTAADVRAAAEAGARGLLVGTTLMRADDPARALKELLEGFP